MSRSRSVSETSASPSPQGISPIPRVTRSKATTRTGSNRDADLVLPAGAKRSRKPTDKMVEYDPGADSPPSPPRKKVTRTTAPVPKAQIPPAAKTTRPVPTAKTGTAAAAKAPAARKGRPPKKAPRTDHASTDTSGPPAPVAKPAMPATQPNPVVCEDPPDNDAAPQPVDRSAANFFQHYPFGPLAHTTPPRVEPGRSTSGTQGHRVSNLII